MSPTPRRLQLVTAAAVVAAWAVLYLVVITTAPLSYDPATESAAKVNREFALLLAVPTALWVTAALLLLDHWWSRTGIRLSAKDPPGRLLAAAVATLPDHRREWGMAMHAELAEVRGRSARWQFALSSARAVLRLPPLGGWPVLALATGVVAAAVAAAGLTVGAAVPGLGVFAPSFVGLVGAMVVLAVARLRRMRLPVPAPTLLATAAVAAAITMTVIFLLRDPTAARYLPPANAVFLAAVLAGCLWIAVAAPRSLGTNRLAPRLGVAAAVILVVGELLLMRAASYEPRIESQGQQLVDLLAALWFWFGPVAVFFFPAFAAGSVGRSFRAGLQAGIWAAIASLPLTYALWLHEALGLYAVNGGLLWFGDGAPEGENLGAALFWTLRFAPCSDSHSPRSAPPSEPTPPALRPGRLSVPPPRSGRNPARARQPSPDAARLPSGPAPSLQITIQRSSCTTSTDAAPTPPSSARDQRRLQPRRPHAGHCRPEDRLPKPGPGVVAAQAVPTDRPRADQSRMDRARSRKEPPDGPSLAGHSPGAVLFRTQRG